MVWGVYAAHVDVDVGMGRRGEKWRGDEMGRPAITDSPCGPPACTALTQSTSLAGVCGNRVGVGCGVVVVVCAVREHSVVRAGRCAYLPKVQARVWAMWGCFGWSVNAYLPEVKHGLGAGVNGQSVRPARLGWGSWRDVVGEAPARDPWGGRMARG